MEYTDKSFVFPHPVPPLNITFNFVIFLSCRSNNMRTTYGVSTYFCCLIVEKKLLACALTLTQWIAHVKSIPIYFPAHPVSLHQHSYGRSSETAKAHRG
eukprot:TRINITY_DN4737_c0_g1_i1.p1 TRINITY_DN4737_c0_g1~~TRINITY_DN4737_c0_g1_i1.p1  ORF type:complete len:99 (+),score=10.63 TRINITY_DN4737_c0_g1_i1:83-379(+)